MATDERGRNPYQAGRLSDAQVAGQSHIGGPPLHVYGCSRLGRHANPPSMRWSFGDLFRRR
jgi:hypothetical protein